MHSCICNSGGKTMLANTVKAYGLKYSIAVRTVSHEFKLDLRTKM